MQYQRARKILWDNEAIDDKKLILGFSKVRMHNKNETNLHFITKALVSKIVFNKGDGITTEAECKNGRVIDVLQIKPSGNLIGYEVETSAPNTKCDIKNVDIIEISVKLIPDNIKIAIKEFEEYLKQYIV